MSRPGGRACSIALILAAAVTILTLTPQGGSAQAAAPGSPPVQPALQEVAQPVVPPGVSLDVVTVVLSYAPGTLRAFESFTLLHNGRATGPLPLPLPAEARQVQIESDLDPAGWAQAAWGLLYRPGLGTDGPVRVSVQFELPAPGLAGTFIQPLPYATAGLAVLADTTTLTAPPSLNTALTDQGQSDVAGRTMQQFSRDAAPAGQELRLSLQYAPTGQDAVNATPIPEPAWLKQVLKAGVPVLLALAAGLGFIAFRRRPPSTMEAVLPLPRQRLQQEKERLVEKISDLDQDFGLGRIAPVAYEHRRLELKRQLMAVLDQLKGA